MTPPAFQASRPGDPETSETRSVPSRSPVGGARRGGRLSVDERLARECLRAQLRS